MKTGQTAKRTERTLPRQGPRQDKVQVSKAPAAPT